MLGIIDWGVGGVSIYKRVNERFPDATILYFSDTGATPYGKMARRELADRLDAVIKFLKSKGMTRLVIGCNAASTAIPDLADHGIKIGGVIEPAVAAVARLKAKDLGVIGGRRTIVSGVYRKAFAIRGIAIKQRIAQPLSALIESGDISSETMRAEAKLILAPLKNCSHILLACTHYPAIEQLLKDYVSPKTKFIDPSAAVVRALGLIPSIKGSEDRFFTSGESRKMKRSANLAFGVEIKTVEKIKI
ncbi:MAG: aspartate/glutamate racemase family protein [bacterium]|nr:aspartate/glutamate racemase family protein [bacterium]